VGDARVGTSGVVDGEGRIGEYDADAEKKKEETAEKPSGRLGDADGTAPCTTCVPT
jgi:hypothetical protein